MYRQPFRGRVSRANEIDQDAETQDMWVSIVLNIILEHSPFFVRVQYILEPKRSQRCKTRKNKMISQRLHDLQPVVNIRCFFKTWT